MKRLRPFLRSCCALRRSSHGARSRRSKTSPTRQPLPRSRRRPGRTAFPIRGADTDANTEDADAGVVLTVHHRVLAARQLSARYLCVRLRPRDPADAIPENELEWSVSRRSLLRFNPDDGSVSIPGDPLGEQVSTGTVELTVKWGKYTDTAVFDLVEQHENAILDRTSITLPANTETTAVPTKIDITQDGVIVLRQIFSGSEFYFDKATQSTVMTDQSYTDEIESVEWIVDDPSIAEAVPQVSPNGKTFYCTFRTYQPGQTCLTCRVTRTDGSTAYQYCDITVAEPTKSSRSKTVCKRTRPRRSLPMPQRPNKNR